MPHTSKRKGQKLSPTRDRPDEEAPMGRGSQSDLNEPRYRNAIFPRDTDRETQFVDDPRPDPPAPAAARRSAPTPLSAAGRMFARDVKLRDIIGCAKFISNYPEVLKEQDIDRKYTHEAITALSFGDPDSRYLAESYVEKCLIVRNCRGKTTREITEYLQPLVDRDKDAWKRFYDDFDLIMDDLKARVRAAAKEARTTPASATENVRSAQSGKNERHTDVGEITKGISQTQIGSTSGYGRPVFSNVQGSSQANFTYKGDAPGSRHAPLPSQTKPTAATVSGERHERTHVSHTAQHPAGGRESEVREHPDAIRRHGVPRTEGSIDEAGSQTSEFSQGRIPSLRGNAVPKAVAIEGKLDPRFKKKSPQEAGRFFTIGRVFAMFWHTEQSSAIPDDISQAKWTMTTSLGTQVFSHIRRFAVVKEGHGYCWAVPINTYRGQGVKKRGFNQADIRAHAIIYMRGKRPVTVNNEPPMTKNPIEVWPADDECELEKASRINFAKVHTVEHNVTVRNIGVVSDDSEPYFTSYWRQHST